VAKSNPHWKMLEQKDSLLIFHGPHAYISPALYEIHESVPTWNYATVHAYGRGTILAADSDKHQVLTELISHFDSSYLSQWNSFDEQYRSRMLNHIVAFEIPVTRIEAKFKLSQNRTKAEQENVIQALGANPDSAISGVAALMRERGPGCEMRGPAKKSTPLAGVRILVGRARQQASALSVQLRAVGAGVIEIPFIEIRPPRSYQALDAALKQISEYDWLILTSVNGVEALAARMRKLKIDPAKLTYLKIASIGPSTRTATEKMGLKVSVVPPTYVAESVVESLRGKVEGRRVLLVRAAVARDVIPRELHTMGATVDVVEAYQTVVPDSSRKKLQAVMADAKQRPQVVTFTSSSTVRNFVELLGGRGRPPHTSNLLDGVRLASIGPITSATLRDFGLPVHIQAEEYTIAGLTRAIVDYHK
jgi:uroporphyrinogen-III synthase